jgi:asparagine N-glycosylation enzyme membrane subunit Stt3
VTFNSTVPDIYAQDAVLGLLLPFWQFVLGIVILAFVLFAAVRLARRGRSRMNTALVVTGTAVISLMILGVLTSR